MFQDEFDKDTFVVEKDSFRRSKNLLLSYSGLQFLFEQKFEIQKIFIRYYKQYGGVSYPCEYSFCQMQNFLKSYLRSENTISQSVPG